jgi:GTP-binding protein EngB required for normal cell division
LKGVAVTRADDDLRDALSRLAALVDHADAGAVAELERRVLERRFRVLVVGEAKRGKSTVVNALLGREVLPTGVVPLTAVATNLVHGGTEQVVATYLDGRTETLPLVRLADLVTETGNPGNRLNLAGVTVELSASLLAGGLELVDTPGTGSVHEHNTAEAQAALERMDAAVFVVSADPPISATERAWLRQVRDRAVRVLCVLNKADYLSPDGLAEAVTFTRDVVRDELGADVEVWPVSARAALASPHDVGWQQFAAAFTSYLEGRRDEDLLVSVARRAGRLAQGVVEQERATLAVLALAEHDLGTRLTTLEATLTNVERARFESAALARATIQRLLQDTTDQAQELVRARTSVVRQAVAEHVTSLTGPLQDVETDAERFAADRIRAVVDAWREQHAAVLDVALFDLDADLRARLDDQFRTVRKEVATLFEFELAELSPGPQLVESRRFSYAFGPEIGQTEALAAAVRTRLPGRVGRRRVDAHILERTALLLDRQVGRARSDFASRLQETERLLLRDLDARFDDGAGRIAEALRRAAQVRADTLQDGERAQADSERRLNSARELAAELKTHELRNGDAAA